MPKTAPEAADYILPLYMNGLNGRMLRLPAPAGKRREILIIAGHHTSHERLFGMAEYLNSYGGVTSPDLPGFGGMDSFYKIGEKPSYNNMADYLAAFIKLRYKRKRLTIIGISYGFTVVTRTLQRYPEIAKKVDLLVSVSGYTHKDDFRWKKSSILLLSSMARASSYRLPSFFITKFMLRGPVIRSIYKVAEKKHPKLKASNKEEREATIKFDIELWKLNDFRTYGYVSSKGLTSSLPPEHIDLPVYHVSVDDDHYFNSVLVEEHMRNIYK
ncbi:MAG TPA: hypothetical protein VFB03_02850, partial [Candidatus Saccharimonadales bacterium]|nr:hypothetical protein [Candidatus Saccharimonadales bacterium]